MDKPIWLRNIRVLVWDFDGVFYRENERMRKAIHREVVKAIASVKNIAYKEAESWQKKYYRKWGSNTRVMHEAGISKKLAFSGKWYAPSQLRYMKRDEKLKPLMLGLSFMKNIILTNTNQKYITPKIKKIGLSANYFNKIFAAPDDFDTVKPDIMVFKKVLEYTALSAEKHLMIGDRVETDLLPAKKLGMKTCLVWSESNSADISLKSIYMLSELFTQK